MASTEDRRTVSLQAKEAVVHKGWNVGTLVTRFFFADRDEPSEGWIYDIFFFPTKGGFFGLPDTLRWLFKGFVV